MKRLLALLLFAFPLFAQQPQTQTAPNFRVNAKYANGVAPGYAPTKGSGLVLNLSVGTAHCSSTTTQTYAGGTLTLTNTATNYVYLNTAASCVPAFNTSGFTSTSIPIAIVTTSGGVITAISDVRSFFTTPTIAATVKQICIIENDTQSATPLTNAQITGRCQVPANSTLAEVNVWASSGTSSVVLERFRPNGATTADLLSAALAAGTSGVFACALSTISGTCVDGITSSGTITVTNTTLNAGDVIRVKSATADGTSTWFVITAIFTAN